MEHFTQERPTTLDDIELNDEVRNLCVESIITLIDSVDNHGGEVVSPNVYVEEEELGVLSMRMRFKVPELGSITVPLMKVGPLYWRWRNEGEVH
tara:strand:+ start:65 stop:346 length:282 start_codon:yes stop_codon:yes gene_type:complete